jgi:hypothetical protein
MSAALALQAARDADIRIGIDGEALILEADVPPPPDLLDFLTRHKARIVAFLRAGDDGWLGENWRAFFQERAEFQGGVPRDQVRTRAFACCVVEWLNRNFVRSPLGRCIACSEGDHANAPLIPHGVESTGHAWLHSLCWTDWHASRKAEAVNALSNFGIRDVRTSP